MKYGIRRKLTIFGAIILFVCISFLSIPTMIAHAGTVEPIVPTYGLFSKTDVINRGSVNYDFANNEQISQGFVDVQSQYTVEATEQATEFIIPFVSASNNIPEFDIKVGGNKR